MKRIKICPVCGKEFIPRHKNQVYCDDEMKKQEIRFKKALEEKDKKEKATDEKESEIKVRTKICPVCGKEFTPVAKHSKYCSKECSDEVKRQYRARYYQQNREKYLDYVAEHQKPDTPHVYTKVCPFCGKEFETTNNRKIYCSDECKNQYNKEKKREKKVYPINTCIMCGKQFTARSVRTRFCCKECEKKYNREKDMDLEYKAQHSYRTIVWKRRQKEARE